METVKQNCNHKDCRYRTTFDGQPACGYMLITGNRRGKNISQCDRYKDGKVKIVSTIQGFKYEDK